MVLTTLATCLTTVLFSAATHSTYLSTFGFSQFSAVFSSFKSFCRIFIQLGKTQKSLHHFCKALVYFCLVPFWCIPKNWPLMSKMQLLHWRHWTTTPQPLCINLIKKTFSNTTFHDLWSWLVKSTEKHLYLLCSALITFFFLVPFWYVPRDSHRSN